MKFHVFLTPMHLVEVECDSHDQVSGVHRFVKGERVIAEFSSCIGWLEVIGKPSGGPWVGSKEPASVTQLTVVSTNAKPPDPAA